MSDKFEPIYLQDAKRHIEWLYEKIDKVVHTKELEIDLKVPSAEELENRPKKKKSTFGSKVLYWLKRIF